MAALPLPRRLARILLGAAATGWLFVCAPAQAADWSVAFPEEAVGSWAIGTDLRCVVVPAGATTPELQAAGSALQAALRADPDVKVVMGGESIADAATLPDKGILTQAQALPIDLVAIVRLVDGASGPTAIVAFFDVGGASRGGFIADVGSPAPVKVTPAPASEPVSSVALARPDALAQYKKRMVWLQGWQAINQYGQVLSVWSVPMKGQDGEALSLAGFYDYIGKPDLAKEVRKKSRVRLGLMLGGGAAVAAGGAWLLAGALSGPSCGYDDGYEVCERAAWRARMPNVIGGAVLSGLGLAMTVVGTWFRTDKTRPDQRVRMVDEFNANLRGELGLPDDLGD